MDFSSPSKALACLSRRLAETQADPALLEACSYFQSSCPLLQADGTTSTDHDWKDEIATSERQAMVLLSCDRWDCLTMGLEIAACLLAKERRLTLSSNFEDFLLQFAEDNLEHSEPRVRNFIAKVLGALCRTHLGGAVYERMRSKLLQSIESQLEREEKTMRTNYPGSEEVPLDDVTGWRSLETSILALQAIADGCGELLGTEPYQVWLREDILEKGVFGVVIHQNRHVRQAAMDTARVLLDRTGVLTHLSNADAMKLGEAIAMGMQDPWPQVVYAASGAARSLMLAVGGKGQESLRASLLPLLLPRMCLNRYYVPEGVQNLSQNTWEKVLKGKGRKTVAHLAAPIADYYCQACKMDNHFSRVAACYATAELAVKIDPSAVEPESGHLLDATSSCLEDLHWEVRSAACVAVSKLASSFPSMAQSVLPTVLPTLMENLSDQCWSIREDAAVALGLIAATSSLQSSVLPLLITHLRSSLMLAEKNPAQSRDEALRMMNDPRAHMGHQVVGCCGGEVKSHTGSCHKAPSRRTSKEWEVSDGCCYLARELSKDVLRGDFTADSFAQEFLPKLADLARLDHFPETDQLRQTIFRCLPTLGTNLGKRVFKQHLDLFLPILLSTLRSPLASQLAQAAAVDSLQGIGRLIGPTILQGRIAPPDQELYLSSCARFGRSANKSSGGVQQSIPHPVVNL